MRSHKPTPAVPTVAVPGAPLRLSRLGFGCSRLFAGIETRASRRLIEAALAAGIRHFDTAPSYSFGQSEQVLGEVLAGASDVTITTKVGLLPAAGGPSALATAYRLIGRPVLARLPRLKAQLMRRARAGSGAPPPAPQRQRTLSRQEIQASVEQSLRRLRRDHIDLLLLHEPDQFRLDEQTLAEFHELQHSGIIRAFGLGYDRVVADPPQFGHVLQSRVGPVTPERSNRLRIWHGVLRTLDSSQPDVSGTKRIQHIWTQRQTDGVLFSASTARQIREVADACSESSPAATLPPP